MNIHLHIRRLIVGSVVTALVVGTILSMLFATELMLAAIAVGGFIVVSYTFGMMIDDTWDMWL